MYAAIRRYELGVGSVEDFAHIVEEGMVSQLSGQPGFLGYQLVASGVSLTGGEEVVALTFFDDEESAVRSNDIAAAFVKERLGEFKLNLTSVMNGTVVLSRTT